MAIVPYFKAIFLFVIYKRQQMIKGNVRHHTKLCIPTNQVLSTNVIFTRILLLIEVRASELLFPQARSIERLSLCACFFILFGSKKQEYRRRTDLNADWNLDVKYATHESDCRKFFCRFCCLGPFCVPTTRFCSICIYMTESVALWFY